MEVFLVCWVLVFIQKSCLFNWFQVFFIFFLSCFWIFDVLVIKLMRARVLQNWYFFILQISSLGGIELSLVRLYFYNVCCIVFCDRKVFVDGFYVLNLSDG